MRRRGDDGVGDDLGRRLERVPIPGGDGARERARGVVSDAFAATAPAPSRARSHRRMAAVAAAALAATAGTVALSPPGEALGDWVRDLVRSSPAPPARAALDALPASGRLLVSGPGGVWVVARDGSRRRLGAYEDATWSPRGRFVAVTRGRQLLAVDPRGGVRWALARPGRVRLPRWAGPDGYRIAYLEGRVLRVVAGDGSGDHALARGVAPVAPAWQPGRAHRLAFVARDGRVTFAEADGRRVLWRAGGPGRHAGRDAPRALAFSGDGRLLMAAGRREIRILDARGRLVRRLPAPANTTITAASVSPDGRRLAVSLRDAIRRAGTIATWSVRGSRDPRVLLDAPGTLSGVTWSPDGAWVLAAWPGADQWAFLRSGPRAGVAAFSGIAAQFDPASTAATGFPTVEGWCCANGS
jgi:hypothetical protein